MNNLAKAVGDYIQLRRSLGYKMKEALPLLLDFVSYLEKRQADHITIPLALEWARRNPDAKPAYWAHRLTHIRRFASHWSAMDPRTEIPPKSLLPHNPQRARPYIYTDKEIRQLLHKARAMGGLHGETHYCFLGLLVVTGLRFSEAQNLRSEDVDLNRGLLIVRGSMHGKTRWIPLHSSTIKVLNHYQRQRDDVFRRELPYFFVTQTGNRIDGSVVRRVFYRLSRQIGLRGMRSSHGPRLHDFRHRFAVKTLVKWYRRYDGDVEQQLPALATYLERERRAECVTGMPLRTAVLTILCRFRTISFLEEVLPLRRGNGLARNTCHLHSRWRRSRPKSGPQSGPQAPCW